MPRHPALWGGFVVLCVGVWLAWLLLPGIAARWVFATLERDWGIVGRAGQVDLNPLTLDIHVRDLTLSAVGAEDQPFLRAEAVTVELPWSVVFGVPAIDRLEIVAPVLAVRQAADGLSNLPVFPPREPTPDAPNASLRLGVVGVHRGSATWVDEARALQVIVGSVELQLGLAEDPAQTTGQLTLSTPTRMTWGARETAIAPLSARLTLDASTLAVRDFVATAPEGRLALDGDIALGASAPSLGLDYRLDLDLTRLATWLADALAISGTVRIAGRLDGPFAAPVVSAWVESDRVGWDELEARGVTATARIAGARVTLDEFRASLAGGTLEGAATVTLTGDETSGEVSLSWADLSADLLSAALWPTRPVAIASSLTGTADALWTGHDPRGWDVTVASRHRARDDAVGPRLPIDGQWQLGTGDGAWWVELDELATGAVSVTGRLQGAVPAALSETGSEPISGNVEGRVSDLQRLAAELETLGLTGALNAADLRGAGSLQLVVSGTASVPLVTGALTVTGEALGRDDLTLGAGLSMTAESWRLDPVALHLAGSEAQGAAVLRPDTGEVEGHLQLRVSDLAVFATELPDGWRPGGTIEIAGTLGGRWPEPVFDATIGATDLVFAGQRIASVEGRVRVSPDELVVERLVVRQEEGQLEASGRFAPPTGDYTLSATGRGLRVAPWRVGDADRLPVQATVDLDLTGAGSMGAPRGTGRFVMRDLSYAGYAVDRVEHELSVDADR